MAKLTEDFVHKLEVPAGAKDVQVFDDKLPGFGVRKFAKGHASYFVKFSVGKQQRKKTLGRVVRGNLQDMRLVASAILVQAHSGVDVVADRKNAAEAAKQAAEVKTLGDLVPIYLTVREKGDEYWPKLRDTSLGEITRYLTKAWAPLHGVAVDQITRKMVKDRRDELVPAGAMSAQRALAALSTFYAWAIDRDYVAGANPTRDIKQLKASKRTRVLDEAELVRIWLAAGDDDFGTIVKLLILTGQRRDEIGELEWSEMPPGKAQIELPEERTKNELPHIVPLSEAALALLRACVQQVGRRYVFGLTGVGFTNWARHKQLLNKRITERRGSPLPHWTLHDLRRSFTTHVNELGFAQPHVTEAILNHVSGSKAGVAGVYNRAVYLPERRAALEQWGRYLTGLVGAPQSVSNQLVSGTKS